MHPVTECSRFVHQIVERKTCPMSNGTPCPMVPHSQSPTTIETVQCESGTSKFLRTKFHATHHLSRWSSSNTQLFWTVCNHKQAIADWSTTQPATCCCTKWEPFKAAALNPSDPHWVLAGSLLHSLVSEELAVVAEGSLLNKVFPFEYQNQLKLGLQGWTKRNGLPSMPNSEISDFSQHLWTEHSKHVTCRITKSSINSCQKTFEGAIFHCEDKQASSLRICCPCLYYQAIEKTFQDSSIFDPVPQDPESIVTSLVNLLHRQHGKSYPWAVGHGRQLPAGVILAKRKKEFRSGRPIISLVDSPFRPMLNILARMIFQLIPVACPNHFASGDVYTLLSILKSAPVGADWRRSHSGQSGPC